MDSILTSIKKLLGITEEDTNFDDAIVMNINMVFMILNQLGVGPDDVFGITGKDETWKDFLGDKTSDQPVQTYVYMKVRLEFDPPANSFVVASMEKQLAEMEWRLNVQAERRIKDE